MDNININDKRVRKADTSKMIKSGLVFILSITVLWLVLHYYYAII